jgi:hypothetical protein
MLKSLTFGGSLILIGSAGFAQQNMQARQIPGNVKDAGVYHLATGTWTRSGSHENLGSKVLYNNTANTGFFGVMGAACNLIWTDEGRIPSTTGHPNAKADDYTVRGVQFAYCSTVPGPQNGGIIFYECYTSCTDPIGLGIAGGFLFQVPGGSASGTRCWIVTFNLKNTTFEFGLAGDCDGVFDGSTALDNFGWTMILNDQGAGGFNGPLLNADPNNVPYGDGTYYQNAGSSLGSGLGTLDQFWINAVPAGCGGYVNGCYWFGGYNAGAPFGSFWLLLTGDNGGAGNTGTKYCVANANSTGAPADITMKQKGEADGNPPYIFCAQPVPNQNGIFFHAQNQAQVPFGCSFLCATGGIVRGAVVNPGGNPRIDYVYNNADVKHSLANFAGQVRNIQYWYRDPMGAGMCGGQTFNTSNAISFTVNP